MAQVMDGLKQRLTYLRNREGLAALALTVLFIERWYSSGDQIAWGLRLTALFALIYILVQGTLYWHFKLRCVVARQPLPTYFSSLFNAFKWSNVLCIGAALVALVVASRSTASPADLGWAAGMIAGAVLEQINYYHYQLMYDTRAALAYLRRNRKLRTAALGLDIARSR